MQSLVFVRALNVWASFAELVVLFAIVNLWSETDSTPATEQIGFSLQSAQMLFLDAIEP